jgi:hypothetical protein
VVASSLAEGIGELTLGAAQQVFGQLGIEIGEFETEGKTRSVPSGEEPFTITDDLYNNPWLGIRLRKPAGFRFVRTDAVWPDQTVVALDGPEGRTVVLEQHEIFPWEEPEKAVWKKLERLVPGGKRGRLETAGGEAFCLDSTDGQGAAAALRRGFEVWVLRTDGKDASLTLRQVAARLEIGEN